MKNIEKILIINYEYPPLGGGGGVATYELAKAWAKKCEVHVLTSSFKGLKSNEIVDGVNIHRCKIIGRKSRDAANFHSMLLYLITGFFKGLSLCKNNKFDVINTHFAVPSGPLGHVLSKLFGIKNVLSLHGGDIYDPSKKMSPHKSPIFKRVVKYILNHADLVIAQSNNTRDNALHYYHPRNDIEIVPLAFSEPEFKKCSRKSLGLDDNDFLLIGIGRLVKRKAFDDAIKIVAGIKNKKVKFLILGDGPEKEYLKKVAAKNNVSDRILFLGYLDDNKKYQYVSNANVMLMTSLHEGFGIIFMEGMYFGLPVVCTNHGGQVDFIIPEKNGLLINVGDIKAGIKAVTRLYADETFRKQCRRNNLKDIKGFYAKKIADVYLKFFNV